MCVRDYSGSHKKLTVPVCSSHSSPPLHPPVIHEFGPGFVSNLQSTLPYFIYFCQWKSRKTPIKQNFTQIRPDFQPSGTGKVVIFPVGASHPRTWFGAELPATFKSVYIAGLWAYKQNKKSKLFNCVMESLVYWPDCKSTVILYCKCSVWENTQGNHKNYNERSGDDGGGLHCVCAMQINCAEGRGRRGRGIRVLCTWGKYWNALEYWLSTFFPSCSKA